MAAPPQRLDDPLRLGAITASGLMDSPPEEAFDRLTRIAARLLGVPTTLVSVVDDRRQFFKSAQGLDGKLAVERGTPLSHSFCQHVVTGGELVVNDARHDARVKDNLAVRDYGIAAYLGIPLVSDTQRLGAFCAVDTKPRQWTEDQISILRDIAAAANSEIRLRAALGEVRQREQTLETMFETANVGILVRDRRGLITRTNRAMCEITGYSEAELVGLDATTIMHPGDVAVEQALRQEILAGKRERVVRSIRFVRKTQEIATMRRSTMPLRGPTGAIQGTVAFVEDVSETLRLQREVERREALHRTIVQNIPNAAVFLYDADLRFIAAEGQRVKSGAIDATKIIGRTAEELVDPSNRAEILDQYRATLEGEVRRGEYEASGRIYELHSVPVRDESDVIVAGMLFSYDVTDRERQAQALDAAQKQLGALIDHLASGVVFEDAKRVVRVANRSFCTLFGLDANDLVGRDLGQISLLRTKIIDQEGYKKTILRRLADRVAVEADRLELIDGRIVERGFVPFDVAGVPGGAIWIFRDVTERERDRAKLAQQAVDLEKLSTRDELTQLYNRRGFMMLAEQELKSAYRSKRKLVVFFADMNGMKEINDKLGHEMGDRALCDTANVLRTTFREADLMARLGGDEFVVLAVDATPDNIAALTARLRRNLEELNAEPGRPFRISLSIGASIYDPERAKSVEALLAEADAVMYEQKKGRRPSGLHVAVRTNK